ncbi:TIGR01212 family radical SAM protein [Candidatus Laterigemmans baculatus]|uniref:TIGR01212 family radical SAM protein n=1 Tax=Candidatus Laterigemmans baculatus TaxID=2770505 RepID=UPI001EEB02E0|nr:TIGR01212 family radical SAM protein [Candidatus Laterigemmans baculatus]
MTHAWIESGLNINAYGAALRRRFGGRVQRVSLDAGFTCPNVDGTLARGGCVFCDNRSFSPSRRGRLRAVLTQLESGIATVRKRYGNVRGFIAYFQPATNTYAPTDQLEELFVAAARHPEVVGLAIGTRPDCVPDEVLELIDALAAERYVSLEFGMQSIHSKSLRWMNRAHEHEAMIDAMRRSCGRRFETCAHVILGIPGETHAEMMQTAAAVAHLEPDGIKLHNLYAVHGTPLGEQVLRGEVEMMEREDYIHTVVDFLERMPPQMIVERVSGEAPSEFLIAPQWCLEKSSIRMDIDAEFLRRGSRQGTAYPPSGHSEQRAPELAHAAGPELAPGYSGDATPEAVRAKLCSTRVLPVLRLPKVQQRS